jgi:tetratricopeptide (TPR) repeat protein
MVLATNTPTDERAILALDDLFSGELLASIPELGPDLGQRILEERDALHQRFLRLAIDGADIVGGVHSETLLRRMSREYPYDEEIEQALLQLLARERPTAVRQAYEAFADRLHADLRAEPGIALRTVAAGFVPALVRTELDIQPRHGRIDRTEQPALSRISVPRVLLLPPIVERGVAGVVAELGAAFIDDLIMSLCAMRSFAVFAPHTARRLLRSTATRAYPTDYLVQTRLISFQGYARMALAMVHTATDEVLFAETLTFAEHRLPDDRTQLVSSITQRLSGTIEQIELAEMRRTGAASAYVHFLRGSEEIRVLELANIRRARKHFRRAVELSPGFTSALSMVARSQCLEWVLLDRADNDLLTSALDLAKQAVRLDPYDPSGHRELGHAKLYLDSLDESVEHLQHATDRAPHHADLLVDQADARLHSMRSLSRARGLIDTALELNPIAPDSYQWIGATIDFFHDDGTAAMSKLMKLENKDAAARLIAAVAASNGDNETAATYRGIFMSRHPDFRLANWHLPLRGAEARGNFSALYVSPASNRAFGPRQKCRRAEGAARLGLFWHLARGYLCRSFILEQTAPQSPLPIRRPARARPSSSRAWIRG